MMKQTYKLRREERPQPPTPKKTIFHGPHGE